MFEKPHQKDIWIPKLPPVFNDIVKVPNSETRVALSSMPAMFVIADCLMEDDKHKNTTRLNN